MTTTATKATTTTKAASVRQVAYDAADTAYTEIQATRELVSARREDLGRELADLGVQRDALLAQIEAEREATITTGQPSPDAAQSREELAALDFEIQERRALLQTAERQSQALSGDAGTAQAAYWQAGLALRREPVETALRAIGETLSQLETDWRTAGRLAKELEVSGDQWGRTALNELLHELTNVHLLGRRDAPFEIEVPQIPALEG
jgi:hypothetical protein